MPTTPNTTGVALPPLLDLLAAPSVGASSGKGSSAFDALLLPPPNRPAASSAAGTAGGSESRPQQETSPAAPQQSPNHPPAADSPPSQSKSNSADPPDVKSSEKPSSETPSDDSEPDSDTSVVAESLAGLPACIAPAPADPLVVNNEAAVSSTPALAKAQGGQQSHRGLAEQTASSGSQASQDSETKAAAAITDSESDGTSKNPLLAPGHEPSENSRLAAAAEPAAAGDHENPAGDASELSAIATAVLESQPTGSNDSGQQREEKSFDQQLDLAAPTDLQAAERLPAPDLQSLAADLLPAAAAPPPQAASAQHQPASTSASSASTAIDPQGPARRARLPGEVVARDTGRTARHSAPAIDATRLLGRVARAFAAAQQRDGEIQLRLSPPELGSLKLTIQMQEGGLAARLETETTAAKTALLDNLPALRERLAEQGLRIERFDVDLMQRQPGGMPDRSGGQEQNAPPVPRLDPVPRPRAEPSLAPRSIAAASNSHSGLNVIV
jgi:flagellar hook-length control protein FliK